MKYLFFLLLVVVGGKVFCNTTSPMGCLPFKLGPYPQIKTIKWKVKFTDQELINRFRYLFKRHFGKEEIEQRTKKFVSDLGSNNYIVELSGDSWEVIKLKIYHEKDLRLQMLSGATLISHSPRDLKNKRFKRKQNAKNKKELKEIEKIESQELLSYKWTFDERVKREVYPSDILYNLEVICDGKDNPEYIVLHDGKKRETELIEVSASSTTVIYGGQFYGGKYFYWKAQ